MKEIGAAELRQSLGKVARTLERDGEPIVLKLGRRAVGVIVSMRDFRERFALAKAAQERARLIADILGDRRKNAAPVDRVLRELRDR
jgi:hypothetical protein